MIAKSTSEFFRACPRAALALAAGLFVALPAFADRPAETIGVPPGPGNGNAPSWAGKAFRQGVVSVANPYGAEAGAQILEAGGNAIDAAVAIAYALNVVEPQSAGVGGGGFMLIHLADSKRTFAIDTREKAPAGATRDMFVGVPNATLQGVAVGVPGMVRGTAMAVERYGRLSLAEVLAPAIELADEGFAATPRYSAVSCNSRSMNSPPSAAYFCPNGGAPPVGSLVTNKPLAATFRAIAQNGPDCFYRYMPDRGCEIAMGIVEGQKFNRPQAPNGKGGSMTLADLENYMAVERVPVEVKYRGYTIKFMTSPSSGGLTVGQMLGMVERFPIGNASQGFGFGSLSTVNVMAEAMRIAFADRAIWMGDADFANVPARGLLHPVYVAARGSAINPAARITPNPVAGDPRPFQTAGVAPSTRLAVADPVTGPGETTTHFSVVDKWGNVVSYTNTIESSHGIGVFAGFTEANGTFRNFGFLLNNELTDFNTTPTTNPVHRRDRLQRRAAEQATPQQHDAGDDLRSERRADRGARLPRRRDDHQLGVQRHPEPDRSRDGRARGDRCAARLGDRGGRSGVAGGGLPADDGRRAAGAWAHGRGFDGARYRLGAGGDHRRPHRQAVRRRGQPPRRHGDRPSALPRTQQVDREAAATLSPVIEVKRATRERGPFRR